jgi:hypothetical protein
MLSYRTVCAVAMTLTCGPAAPHPLQLHLIMCARNRRRHNSDLLTEFCGSLHSLSEGEPWARERSYSTA